MLNRRAVVTGTIAAFGLPGAVSAQGSGATVRLVVPYGPGGSTDTSARVLAERMASDLGKVDHRREPAGRRHDGGHDERRQEQA
jgi:tripartite-type tricarboxylate transporter receptor subunit TctC